MKKCYYCAEEIQDDAKKCKHCGSMLDGSAQPQNVNVTGRDAFAEYHTPIKGKSKGSLTLVGAMGIGLGILIIIVGLFSLGSATDSGEGSFLLMLFGLGVSIASFLWARTGTAPVRTGPTAGECPKCRSLMMGRTKCRKCGYELQA